MFLGNLLVELIIQLLLSSFEGAEIVIDYFFREFLKHIGFHSPHDERHDFEVQFLKDFLLLFTEDQVIFFESLQVNLK